MSKFAKIIHLSDLHIGYGECSKRFDCIVNNIASLKTPAEDYVIVVTGDSVDKATPENLQSAKSYFDKLKAKGFTVLVAPGNHDYGSGGLAEKKYMEKFKETFYGNPNYPFPKLDIVEHKIGNKINKVAFIGLDSMEEELNYYDCFGAQGELGKEQLARLKKLLSPNGSEITKDMEIVIYLHHHVIETHYVFEPLVTLKDAEDLRQILEDPNNYKVDAILYGHRHHGGKSNGAIGKIERIYDGGTATQKQCANGPTRVINLDKDARWDYDAEFLKF